MYKLLLFRGATKGAETYKYTQYYTAARKPQQNLDGMSILHPQSLVCLILSIISRVYFSVNEIYLIVPTHISVKN